MIRAEVHDDEFRTSARFDATDWFKQASDQEIKDLAAIDWRGDLAADGVAEFFTGDEVGEPETIDKVFQAANVISCGYEVSVEPQDALNWLKDNRPELFAELA